MFLRKTVTKIFRFAYSHSLPNHNGRCKNLHGHNAKVEVTIGEPITLDRDVYPSMVIDFKDINVRVGAIIDELDHKHLNDVLPEQYLPATAENCCAYLLARIEEIGLKVVKIRFWEADDSYATLEVVE